METPIEMKRSRKHRYFVELLLSDAELELLASSINAQMYSHPSELLGSWKDLTGKVLLSGLEDSDGLGAELNNVLALGFAVSSHLKGTALKPQDSYWHCGSESIPLIDDVQLYRIPCEWEDQVFGEWADVLEAPHCYSGEMPDQWRGDRAAVVCLCGSTKFKDEYAAAARREEDAGRIVLTTTIFSHSDGVELAEAKIKQLKKKHDQ